MVLDEICNANLYDTNAFHLLGVTVDVTPRKIRRRKEDVIDGQTLLGDKSWRNEFDKYLLGNCKTPEVDVVANLFERLKEPEYFATEMFFWFWPQEDEQDEAIEAVLSGRRDLAVCRWFVDKNRAGEPGVIARHNLAVVLHLYAMDGETYLCSHENDVDTGVLQAVDQYWKASFDLWESLVSDDFFWEIFSNRVDKLNDPRLDVHFIDSFRKRFPFCFDNINADFIRSYLQSDRLDHARRHLGYMVSTMRGADDVEATLEKTFKPLVDNVHILVRRCEGAKGPKEVLVACRELLKGATDMASVFRVLVPDGNGFTRGVVNEVTTTIDRCLAGYCRDTGDYEPALNMLKEVIRIASTPLQVERIQKSIDEVEELVRMERRRSTCCVCGRYQKGMGTREIRMYTDVHENPVKPGRVEWRTRTISGIPVCASCTAKFKYEHAREFEPVRKSLAEGWKFGEKPSQYEIDQLLFLGDSDD